jgi:hypothetical protein
MYLASMLNLISAYCALLVHIHYLTKFKEIGSIYLARDYNGNRPVETLY